ncbi:hypothetical protein [Mycolicibacterium fortuitum]|uniref:hypothetical protein n=1 Tax=Mycolicibacterium fortuitum TaxID=1766 RepID=UPI003AADB280
MTAPTIDRTATTTEFVELIARDCWLYAHIRDNTLYVFRSVALDETDTWCKPVTELVGSSEPLTRETISDPNMMFGRAEVLTYAMPPVAA